MRDTEEGVGVVGETVGVEETDAADIEAVAFEAVVNPELSTSTGCMFWVGGCEEPLTNPLLSDLRKEFGSELDELGD